MCGEPDRIRKWLHLAVYEVRHTEESVVQTGQGRFLRPAGRGCDAQVEVPAYLAASQPSWALGCSRSDPQPAASVRPRLRPRLRLRLRLRCRLRLMGRKAENVLRSSLRVVSWSRTGEINAKRAPGCVAKRAETASTLHELPMCSFALGSPVLVSVSVWITLLGDRATSLEFSARPCVVSFLYMGPIASRCFWGCGFVWQAPSCAARWQSLILSSLGNARVGSALRSVFKS